MVRKLVALIVILMIQLPLSVHAKDWVYVVVEGDNIWNISKRFLTDIKHFKDVQKLNNIPVAKQLQTGTVLRVPLQWVKKHAAKVTVKSTSGENTKVRDGQTTSVDSDTIFNLGDELRVGPKATITLVFADKTEVTLSNGVLITFDHLSHYGETGMVDTRIRLQQGKVEIRAQKQKGAGSRLDIQTASAITSVRGTIFRVGVDKVQTSKKPSSVVEVLEGEVAVSAGDKFVAVKQGFGLKIEKGQALQQPTKLLPAPKITEFNTTVELVNTNLVWQKVDLAESYVIQIATDKNFSNIQWHQQQAAASIILPTLNDGRYFVRISAIAYNGVEGLTDPIAFNVNIYPVSPKLTPVNTIYISEPTALTWSPVDNINNYILQVSSDPSFSTLVIDTQTKHPYFMLKTPLDFARYYWRVASLQGPQLLDKGPVSQSSSFNYSTKLTPPELNLSSRDNNIEVTWNALPNNQHVELQTATTIDFIKTKTATVNSKNSYRFELKNQEPIYIRARAVLTKYNVTSEWSNHCKIAGSFEICR